jgi:hypothetical protein
MAKIGRNDKCPCRSGKKFKKCCGLLERAPRLDTSQSPEQALKVTLMDGVREIQADAAAKKSVCRELGVFFFYSTPEGGGWMLEMTQNDCVQVAEKGEILEPPIDENSETIEINWSHMYALRDKKFVLTAYANKGEQIVEDAPTREINAAIRRITRKYSSEQLEKVHVTETEHAPKA